MWKLYNALFFFQILNFADGEKYKFVDVTIIDDNIPEGDEMFQLILANPSRGLELGNNTTGKTKENYFFILNGFVSLLLGQ